MATKAPSFGFVLLAGLLLGCGGTDPGVDEVAPPPDAGPDLTPSPPASQYGARVAISASGPFGVAQKVVRLGQRAGAAEADTVADCTWQSSTDLAVGQRHVYDCGGLEPQAGVRDRLAQFSATFENQVASGPAATVTHELAVSGIAIELVQFAIDGEEAIDGQTCALDERLGRAEGDTALPNLLTVQFGAAGCTVVSRERYLNTIWLAIAGTPRGEFKKYLYAGQDPGGRPLIGGFSSQTYVVFDFVTPAVPTPEALVVASVANMPENGSYDHWVLSGVSVRSGSGLQNLDLVLPISCAGAAADASQITCWTDGHDLRCSSANLCNL